MIRSEITHNWGNNLLGTQITFSESNLKEIVLHFKAVGGI